MFKKVLSFILVGFMLLSLTACGGSDKPAVDDNGEKAIKVAFVFTHRGDKSVSDAVWVGAQKAEKELGIDPLFIELPVDTSKYRAAVLEASESDAQLIIGSAGSGLIDELYRAAGEYPEKYYMVLDAPADMEIEHPNFIGQSFKQNEAAYLVGYLGALLSETGTIGGIVGVEYPVLSDFFTGYLSGAKDANLGTKVATSVIGDFLDAAKAKELANVQYNLGADIVFNIAGPAGFGILEAAKDQGKLAFGVDTDQAALFVGKDDEQAEAIVTSALKGWGEATFAVIDRFVKGADNVPWQTVERLGVAENGVGIAENDIYKKLVSTEIQAQMDQLIQDISDGKVTVPSFFDLTADQYNELKNSLKP